MPYICPNCGERNNFVADASCNRSYRAYGSVAVDSDGDWSDFEERNGEDYETDDLDFDNVACSHCAAEAIWCETEAELDATLNGRVFSRILQAHNFSSGGVTSLNY